MHQLGTTWASGELEVTGCAPALLSAQGGCNYKGTTWAVHGLWQLGG